MPRPAILARVIGGGASRMFMHVGNLLAGGLWIVLAVVGTYGVAIGGWRAIGGRALEDFGLLLTGCIACVLFVLLGMVMR